MSDTASPPSASAWVRAHLTALYEPAPAPHDANPAAPSSPFQAAFARTFAPACEVRENHAPQALQTFCDEWASRLAAAARVRLAWEDVVATNEDKAGEPAVVAGAFVVTRTLPWRIRVTQAQRRTRVHFSARIEPCPGVQDGDQRQITSFYYTSVDTTPPIHFGVPRATQETGKDGQ